MKKNKLIYYFLEIDYYLLSIALMFISLNTYSSVSNEDIFILLALGFAILSCLVMFGPVLGKIADLIISIFFFALISSQHSHFLIYGSYYTFSFKQLLSGFKIAFPAIKIVVFFLFILLYYFLEEKHKPKVSLVTRICAPSLLAISSLFLVILNSEVKKEPLYYGYNLNNTSYYAYVHPEKSAEYVDNFGLLSYIYQDLSSVFTKEDHSEEITSYLQKRAEILPSSYQGIFEGKNVIFIQTKELSDAIINPQDTPNLSAIKEKCILINRFDTPQLFGKTGDSEFMANVSLFPIGYNQETIYSYDDNTYPTTLPKMFSNSGYFTYLFYGNYGTYYNRSKMSSVYGYDEFYTSDRLGILDEPLDVVAEKVADILYWGVDRYMAYWIANDYSSITELDLSIGKIMDYISQNGSNTVLVIFPDGTGESKEHNYMMIYNGQNHKNITKFSTLVDLLPSMANLFSLSYDRTTVLGEDIFSDSYKGFAFNLSNEKGQRWSSNLGYYDYKMHRVNNHPDEFTDEDVLKYMEDYAERIKLSHMIVREDYFRKKQ